MFLERGNFFVLLFFVIASGVALLLLRRGLTRVHREVQRRGSIALVTLTAVALWLAASHFVLEMVFDTAWALAHTRLFPEGRFPEGWPIYGYLGAYLVFGAALVRILRTVPPIDGVGR